MVGGYRRPVAELTAPFMALLLPLVRKPPFYDEVLGQLQAHDQFPNLGAGERELTLLGIAGLESSRPLLEKDALPVLELMGRYLALARHRVERFAPHEANDQLSFALDTPFGGLELLRCTG